MSTSTFGLDPTTGDLALVPSGIGQSLPVFTGPDAIAQHLKCRLRLVRTEWFADLDAGMDYFGTIWRKGATDTQIAGEIKKTILGTEDVSTVSNFVLDRDSVSRTVTVSFTAHLVSGQSVPVTDKWSA